MALIVKPNTFSAGGSIVASEHNSNYDTIYNEFNGSIANANIDAAAAIVDTKLAQITTGSKVSAAAITSLASLPAGAGNIPSANSADKVVLSATDTPTELTLATGAVTVTQSYHTLDTESDAASDDLDTINGGVEGMLLVIRAVNSARTVVAKDGTGNIQCGGDFSLQHVNDTMMLIYDSTASAWLELGRTTSN